MQKYSRLFLLASVFVILLGCTNKKETNNSPNKQIEMENQIAEQQQKIDDLEKIQAENEKFKEREQKQVQIEECKKIKEKCKSQLAIIGMEEIELFNEHETSYGIVKGDRHKAIEELNETIKKDKKYIEEKEEEIEDYGKDGAVYKATKNSIQKKYDDIDRSEKKIKKIEELIVKEQNQKNSLLNGECTNYEAPCE